MPIVIADIKFYLSGGVGNSDVDLSLGGAISTTEVTSATLHNLFDIVYGAEAITGDVEYRCIYVKNTHGSLDLQTAIAWISSNTPSTSSTLDIGLGTSAISAEEQTVADESTAPSGVTFTAPISLGVGLAIGNLAAAATMAIWLRRTVLVAAGPYDTDTATVNVGGDTAA